MALFQGLICCRRLACEGTKAREILQVWFGSAWFCSEKAKRRKKMGARQSLGIRLGVTQGHTHQWRLMGLGRMQAASIDATGPVYFHAAMDLCLVKRGETV